ncbi:E3 ubiquitin-protein ligase SDIR1-like [Mercurialis annua]|uniref:E3 ubiquitin-protein ligase SDIR1-like n=1 Tax=Mercurialis annua TaxID=3986 RepID=UPI0021609415|nr:E3 ubiquitin-protein ligase SDIR1-like [Mercurialis annua]
MTYIGHDGISCRVVLLDEEEAEQEKTTAFSDGKFLIKIVPTSMLKEDDRKQPPGPTVTLLHEDLIFDSEMFQCTIRGILADLDLPTQERLIDHIYYEFVKIFVAQIFDLDNKKILYILVHVEQESESESESDDDYYEELEPAEESVIDALGKLKIESDNGVNRCTICLEELVIGSEATRMACSHIFHQECIRSWLQINGVCPLCRDQIASSLDT